MLTPVSQQVVYMEKLIADWTRGQLPTGKGATGEMEFVMRSPGGYAKSHAMFKEVVKRLTQEEKIELAKALDERLLEIGRDFGVIHGSPLMTGEILTHSLWPGISPLRWVSRMTVS